MIGDDLSCEQIAKNIHAHPNTFATWIKQFKAGTVSAAAPHSKVEYKKKQLPNNLEMDYILSAIAVIENQVEIMKRLIVNYQ